MTDEDKNIVKEPVVIYGQPVAPLDIVIEVLGGFQSIGKKISNILDFVDITEKGLPIVVLKKLQKRMQFTNRELGKTLDMSESTLQRRLKQNQKLDKKESESAVDVATVWAKGLEVFDNDEQFRHWLHTNNTALGNNKPIDFLHSPIGRDEIKDILNRIEWGIYS